MRLFQSLRSRICRAREQHYMQRDGYGGLRCESCGLETGYFDRVEAVPTVITVAESAGIMAGDIVALPSIPMLTRRVEIAGIEFDVRIARAQRARVVESSGDILTHETIETPLRGLWVALAALLVIALVRFIRQ